MKERDPPQGVEVIQGTTGTIAVLPEAVSIPRIIVFFLLDHVKGKI